MQPHLLSGHPDKTPALRARPVAQASVLGIGSTWTQQQPHHILTLSVTAQRGCLGASLDHDAPSQMAPGPLRNL